MGEKLSESPAIQENGSIFEKVSMRGRGRGLVSVKVCLRY